MIDLSGINSTTVLGRALRFPLRWLPPELVVPVLQGPARGMRWVVGTANHGCWIGSYEAPVQAACARLIRPGMVVYDVGANVGFYSLVFSRLVGSGGSVQAFEPVADNCRALQRHLALNSAENVELHPVAVAAVSGSARFDSGPNRSMGRLAGTGFLVPTISLDDFVYERGRAAPHFVKMDIEGGEVDALDGMRRLLRQRRPRLLISIHGPRPATQCARILSSEGYRITNLQERPIGHAPAEGDILAEA